MRGPKKRQISRSLLKGHKMASGALRGGHGRFLGDLGLQMGSKMEPIWRSLATAKIVLSPRREANFGGFGPSKIQLKTEPPKGKLKKWRFEAHVAP